MATPSLVQFLIFFVWLLLWASSFSFPFSCSIHDPLMILNKSLSTSTFSLVLLSMELMVAPGNYQWVLIIKFSINTRPCWVSIFSYQIKDKKLQALYWFTLRIIIMLVVDWLKLKLTYLNIFHIHTVIIIVVFMS